MSRPVVEFVTFKAPPAPPVPVPKGAPPFEVIVDIVEVATVIELPAPPLVLPLAAAFPLASIPAVNPEKVIFLTDRAVSEGEAPVTRALVVFPAVVYALASTAKTPLLVAVTVYPAPSIVTVPPPI